MAQQEHTEYAFYDVLFFLTTEATERKFCRTGWANVAHIAVQWPDENSANTRPYIYAVDNEGERVPWLASQVDMVASDYLEILD